MRIAFLGFLLLGFSSLRAGDFVKTDNGIVVFLDAQFSGNVREIHLVMMSDNIVRITGVIDKTIEPMQSFSVTAKTGKVPFKVITDSTAVFLVTAALRVGVDLQTGQVSFFDASGKRIMQERQMGRQITPTVFDGTKLYHIRQDFDTPADDAWYGLGQHQDGLMNYRSHQIKLFQNNTEVAVPFLISRKNYGILWDNASITDVGSVRAWLPLSQFRVHSLSGGAGWLTATYYNDTSQNAGSVLERPESDINMEFLGDSKLYLPADFVPEKGRVVWEGTIGTDIDGKHQIRFSYGGYLKVWIDDSLILDRWRQAWNPGSAIVGVDFMKAKDRALKIEWIPSGTESYLTFKWLPPLAEEAENQLSFSSEAGQQLDYYFIYGRSMDDVISGYRQLTGKAVMIPRWAFGFWQSRERYKTQSEVLQTAAEFRKRQIPIDNIVQDWFYWKEDEWGSQAFDVSRFPSPGEMIDSLHQHYHMRFMISVWPKFYVGVKTYKDFNSKGWLYIRNIADSVRDWVGKGYHSTFYDAFNAGARKGFWDLINDKIYSKNIDAWWMDASEPDILSNVSPARRKEQMKPISAPASALVLNAYPLLNAKGIYDGQRETDPEKRVFILTRSAFPGLQAYAAATWSGDIASRWHDMKAQISAGVNLSMSGIPYWTMDIGGFAVEPRFEKPNEADLDEWRELNTRWYQFGSFVPLFRVHGQYPFREIYNIAPNDHPAYQSMLYYNKLRYRLLPYVYSVAGNIYRKDGTMMRGLVMDFPDDIKAANLNDAFMFGPSLLINPVLHYQARSRNVYLPIGADWYNLYDGTFLEGGKEIVAEAPYERMPVFVKSGSIISFGPALQYTSEKNADPITLYVYGGSDGTFDLYEDEGTNYNYENGRYTVIPIKYDDKNKTLTIGKREGAYEGMLQSRTFNIIFITKKDRKGIDRKTKTDRVLTYSGAPLKINLK